MMYVVKEMLEPTVRQLQFNNIIYKRTPEIYLQYHNHIHTRPQPIFILFEFNLITMLYQFHEKYIPVKKDFFRLKHCAHTPIHHFFH